MCTSSSTSSGGHGDLDLLEQLLDELVAGRGALREDGLLADALA